MHSKNIALFYTNYYNMEKYLCKRIQINNKDKAFADKKYDTL